MIGIITVGQSKANCMKTHIKLCSKLNNKKFNTILIGGSLITGLTRYIKVCNKFLKSIDAINIEIGGRMPHVLQRALFHLYKMLLDYVVYQDSTEGIVNGLIKIASCVK